ncbi:NINE protein [Helicobacter sp. MIT 21-1697]|uniref:NINE protein n=1 Tax=Helicobacter sp. MIT 21-1697 TaxID=2993733 RepID=UPI00224A5EC2|nr:NINE protein [Helicobacter sp. MIT 21-1697]MCX2717122.1 NINE protein [Helicobacter sp. MIT 21-1697]
MQEENGQLQASIISGNWEGKVSKDSLMLLQGRLAQVTNENAIASFGLIQLKSPVVGLILGLLFGGLGVDRFYKGDMGLGALKLIVFIIGFALSFLIIPPIFPCIWILLDFFLVYRGIRKDNFEKINKQLLLSGV